jgi:hypothetical protein
MLISSTRWGSHCEKPRKLAAPLRKIRMGRLDHFQKSHDQQLESEANQLASIFAAIILNMRLRLDEQNRKKQAVRRKPT